MFKRTMRKLSGLKNRASWSWGHSWLRPDRLQVIKAIFVVHPVPTQRFYQPSETNSMWCFCVSSRAGGSSEICEAFPDFHQQGQGGPAGSLSAGSLSGHGGSNGAGSWAVSWMHWVGQGREENLPTTGSGGKEVLNKLVGAIKRHKRNLILCMIFFFSWVCCRQRFGLQKLLHKLTAQQLCCSRTIVCITFDALTADEVEIEISAYKDFCD